MRKGKNPRLLRLIWWSVRLSWSRRKATRRRLRQRIWSDLGLRWCHYFPEASPGSEIAIVRAVWLGASLASRTLWRSSFPQKRLKTSWIWMARLAGKTNGKAIVAAYLAWVWLDQVASSSVISLENWGRTGG